MHVWGRGEVHTGFRWGTRREGEDLEQPGIYGRIILKWIFETWDGDVKSIWLGIGTGGGLL
jgi:hypothetical protein